MLLRKAFVNLHLLFEFAIILLLLTTINEYKILDILGDKASVYEGLEDDSIKRLYFPTVVFVNEDNSIKKITSYEKHGEIG